MPRTAREPFRKHTVQVEFNVQRTIPGTRQKTPSWQFVQSLECLVIPGTAQRGARFASAGESIYYQVFFRTNPGLTTGHRLRFRGAVLNYLGSFQPGGTDKFWMVYANQETQEQPSNFMNMLGAGLSGAAVIFQPALIGGATLEGQATIS